MDTVLTALPFKEGPSSIGPCGVVLASRPSLRVAGAKSGIWSIGLEGIVIGVDSIAGSESGLFFSADGGVNRRLGVGFIEGRSSIDDSDSVCVGNGIAPPACIAYEGPVVSMNIKRK